MISITTAILSGTFKPNIAHGCTRDCTNQAARQAEDAFYAWHGGIGQRIVYRFVSALS